MALPQRKNVKRLALYLVYPGKCKLSWARLLKKSQRTGLLWLCRIRFRVPSRILKGFRDRGRKDFNNELLF